MTSLKKFTITSVSVCLLFCMIFVTWTPVKRIVLIDQCLEIGGKWAENGAYCISRQCAADGTCKPSYGNNSVCSALTTPVAQDELYFNLGMPEHQEGNIFIFAAGGGGYPIKATIIDGIATNLNCGL